MPTTHAAAIWSRAIPASASEPARSLIAKGNGVGQPLRPACLPDPVREPGDHVLAVSDLRFITPAAANSSPVSRSAR